MMKFRTITCFYFLAVLLGCWVTSCNDEVEIKQDYSFSVSYLPVPKKLGIGETAEIRCEILREGYYDDTVYRMRYFQPDGAGELKMDDGTVLKPNDYYSINRDIFRLYYTCEGTEQQTLDIYFFDSFNNSCTLSFSFNADTSGGINPTDPEVDNS